MAMPIAMSTGPAAAGSGKRKSSSSSSSAAASEKKSKPDHCTWIGKLEDAHKHFEQCPYAGAVSRCDCRGAIHSLRQEIQSLRQDNKLLREKVNRQPQEIVFTVSIDDLSRYVVRTLIVRGQDLTMPFCVYKRAMPVMPSVAVCIQSSKMVLILVLWPAPSSQCVGMANLVICTI